MASSSPAKTGSGQHPSRGAPSKIHEALECARLVPVIVITDAADARPLTRALIAGNLRIAEVTFRTDAAEAAIRRMADDPELVVGAGTVLTRAQVDRAVEAGARFVVTPGFSPKVVTHCLERSVPVFPGVATATEIQMALDVGVGVVKFFPAESLGGVGMLKALAAPFSAVRFIPTGGIRADDLPAYLAHPAVLAVGGSWMVARELIVARDWKEITRRTADAVAMATST